MSFYINQDRLRGHVQEYLNETITRFESTLRLNPEGISAWNYTDEFFQKVESHMNCLVDSLCELVIERAKQRCKDKDEVFIIEQDVFDSYDVYCATLQNQPTKK